ncbi:xanthine dehydrogenase small subunit [Chitinimonas sp.]|uniref:xanthine dehydrogenase small subunit n=1 Tax=Chitinimonas sp. TaxID=1934313 RepID=UPI002F926C52
MSERPIHFYYRNVLHRIDGVPPTRTVLQHLREDLHCTGSKEGCAEGDCGACTVVLGELQDGVVRLRAINSCIQFLPSLDGKALYTVEDLTEGEALHPVQTAMVDCHASQCGFCTPGFVMSLWAMYEQHPEWPGRDVAIDACSGNLCRCTGYRPILDAAEAAYQHPPRRLERAALVDKLQALAELPALQYLAQGQHFFAPRSVAELARLRLAYPAARLLAGSTDVGLWVTKQLRELGDLIYLGQVAELRQIRRDARGLEIGAAVPLSDAFEALCQQEPHWLDLARRFASVPMRNAGTLGGNVANGSPIGDSMPALIALSATLSLQCGEAIRSLPLEDFYLGYQQTALQPGEFLRAIHVPTPSPGRVFRSYKLSKRYEQDISAVCAAFALTLDTQGKISEARVAFGGMAAIPRRAPRCEAVLLGQAWNETTLRAAQAALHEDYLPLSDMRASADYRQQAAAGLLERYWRETTQPSSITALWSLTAVEVAP